MSARTFQEHGKVFQSTERQPQNKHNVRNNSPLISTYQSVTRSVRHSDQSEHVKQMNALDHSIATCLKHDANLGHNRNFDERSSCRGLRITKEEKHVGNEKPCWWDSPKTETALTLTKVQFAAALSNLVSTKDELKTFYGLYPCIKGNSIYFHDFTSKRQGNSLPSENKDSITIKDNFVVS